MAALATANRTRVENELTAPVMPKALPPEAAAPEALVAEPLSSKLHDGPTFREGTHGVEVFKLQERLNSFLRTHQIDRINVDGDFGPKTKEAVKKTQELLNSELKLNPPLDVDGIWGPKSEAALARWQQRNAGAHETRPRAAEQTFEKEGWDHGTLKTFTAKKVLDIDGKSFIMAAPVAEDFERMRAAAAKDGIMLRINSAFRSNEEQQELYDKFKAGKGNPANRPGHSDHQMGIAIDIRLREDPRVLTWLDKNAAEFGFDRPKRGQVVDGRKISNEPWHWEHAAEREKLRGK